MTEGACSASRFKPAWWLRNHHLQTLWPQFTRRGPKPAYFREVIDLPDGDFLDLDWHGELDQPTKLAILIHGLAGNSRSHYIRGLSMRLAERGVSAAAINLRGSSGRQNRRPKTYHSGHTSDIAHVAGTLRKRFPDLPIYAVGFSLGGNALLKWLGEQPSDIPLQKAVAVSVPFDLDNAADRLESGFSRIYQRRLLGGLKKSLKQRTGLFQGKFDESVAKSAKNFRQFDHALTARVNGFRSGVDYYSTCSSGQYLRHVRTPTLVIHAADDPFMSKDAIPHSTAVSPDVRLEITNHGGHVGFIGPRNEKSCRYWLEHGIPDYLCEDGTG